MWELYVNGQYIDSYSTKWEAVAAVCFLPDGVDWHIEYFSGQ